MSEQAKEVSLAVRVANSFMACLFKDGETTDEHAVGKGIVRNFGFHPGRLDSQREAVRLMLHELPIEFHAEANGGKGGWSFLNSCVDRSGEQWGEHHNAEQLIALGNALGMVSFPMPAELWPALPGGVPYFVIDAGPVTP